VGGRRPALSTEDLYFHGGVDARYEGSRESRPVGDAVPARLVVVVRDRRACPRHHNAEGKGQRCLVFMLLITHASGRPAGQ